MTTRARACLVQKMSRRFELNDLQVVVDHPIVFGEVPILSMILEFMAKKHWLAAVVVRHMEFSPLMASTNVISACSEAGFEAKCERLNS